MHDASRTYRPTASSLSEREREVLRLVVKNFITTAGPVGSRFLSEHSGLGLSPASIRNTMSDLESQGYLDHPYTSAGRVPTERGYRTFVDELMNAARLTPLEARQLEAAFMRVKHDTEEMLRVGSRILGELTNLLGVVLSPRLSTGTLERLDVVPLSSSRIMFVLSIRGGLIRTLIFHAETDLNLVREDLSRVVSFLNERLAGLTLDEIRRTCIPRIQDVDADRTGLLRLVLSESAVLFREVSEDRQVNLGGTANLLAQPEFQDPEEVREVFSLLEDEPAVARLVEEEDEPAASGSVAVRIGSENEKEKLSGDLVKRYSVVTARYVLGDTVGTLGVIGPVRMDYPRVITLVERMAGLMSRLTTA